jgi:3-deoxy-D-manno-octulosonate cytidylyltransferase
MSSPILCVIPARYGSTRLPAKALIEVAGLPLVMWVCRAAEKAGCFDTVLVATDDERIAAAVGQHGGRAVMTRRDHERGTDRVFEAAQSTSHPYIVNLQGDEPETPAALLQAFARELVARVDDNSLLTCVSHAPAREMANPNVVKVALNCRDEALYFSRAPIPYGATGDDATFVKHAGIYGFSRASLGRFCGFPPGRLERQEKLEQLRALENGMAVHCMFHDHQPKGIDTQADLDAFRNRIEKGPARS